MKGLILIYVITALASVIALRRPKIGLYVYVGFAVLRPQSIWGWAGDLSGMSFIVGAALLCGWALKGFGSWRGIGRGRPVVYAFVAFAVWSALSAIQAIDTDRSFGALVELAKVLLPFLVGVTMLEGEKDWKPLLWTIVLAQGYVGFEMNTSYLSGYNKAADGFGGMDNNCFAVSLVTILGIALGLSMSAKKWWARGLAAVSAALILHATLLTFSRGAMVGLLAVAFVAFVLMPKRPMHLAAMLLALVLVARYTGPELAARYASAFVSSSDRDTSAESRIDLWKDCLVIIKAAPLLGVGPWNWRAISSRFGWSEGKSAHSVWMETAAETGIPGALALLAIFGLASVAVWPLARARLSDANREQKVLAVGIILSMVGFVVSGQFVSVTGLEAPYYIALVSVLMLKTKSAQAVAAPATAPMLGAASLSGGRSRVLPVGSARPALAAIPRRSAGS